MEVDFQAEDCQEVDLLEVDLLAVDLLAAAATLVLLVVGFLVVDLLAAAATLESLASLATAARTSSDSFVRTNYSTSCNPNGGIL